MIALLLWVAKCVFVSRQPFCNLITSFCAVGFSSATVAYLAERIKSLQEFEKAVVLQIDEVKLILKILQRIAQLKGST